jgi:hypothetical protein
LSAADIGSTAAISTTILRLLLGTTRLRAGITTKGLFNNIKPILDSFFTSAFVTIGMHILNYINDEMEKHNFITSGSRLKIENGLTISGLISFAIATLYHGLKPARLN